MNLRKEETPEGFYNRWSEQLVGELQKQFQIRSCEFYQTNLTVQCPIPPVNTPTAV